jgi:hypothetical protein
MQSIKRLAFAAAATAAAVTVTMGAGIARADHGNNNGGPATRSTGRTSAGRQVR